MTTPPLSPCENSVSNERLRNTVQIPRLEDYLHELLSDRKRFLKTIEALTNELVKREADADKRAHERKALKMKVTMLEQDKQALEHGARAATDEHRSERARWAAHKQVRRRGRRLGGGVESRVV